MFGGSVAGCYLLARPQARLDRAMMSQSVCSDSEVWDSLQKFKRNNLFCVHLGDLCRCQYSTRSTCKLKGDAQKAKKLNVS